MTAATDLMVEVGALRIFVGFKTTHQGQFCPSPLTTRAQECLAAKGDIRAVAGMEWVWASVRVKYPATQQGMPQTNANSTQAVKHCLKAISGPSVLQSTLCLPMQ